MTTLGAAGVAGLAAGFQARPILAPEPASFALAAVSPSDIVDLRFPSDWSVDRAAAPVLAFASAAGDITLFDPNPVYSLAPVKASSPDRQATANPKLVMQPAAKSPVAPAPRPAHRSNALLNDSQIAGIKKRLNLTPDQERYWPAVEAQLRKMEYTKDTSDKKAIKGMRLASVDMTKVDVEGLKSAGFPLVMSFSDEQRRELKSLAHLLGLEGVMSGL